MKRSLLKIFGKKDAQEKAVTPGQPQEKGIDLPSDLYTFVYLPQYKVWIGKYPVTNLQYQRFLEAPDYFDKRFWVNFPRYDAPPDYLLQGDWGEYGWRWLQVVLNPPGEGYETVSDMGGASHRDWLQIALKYKEGLTGRKRLEPLYWQDPDFGIQRPGVPVVMITWWEANAYCKWLQVHWDECQEAQQNSQYKPEILRLPLEAEWEEAAGGGKPEGRFAWDQPGEVTTDPEEIRRRANIDNEIWNWQSSQDGCTTPVNRYPLGVSPLGVWDLNGNVEEWQANFRDPGGLPRAVRGGGWMSDRNFIRDWHDPEFFADATGFRVVCVPRSSAQTPAFEKEVSPQQPVQMNKTPVSTIAAEHLVVSKPQQPSKTPDDPEKVLPADLYTFVYLPQCKGWIGKYPVTNLQYQRFLEAEDFCDPRLWMNFPKFGPPPGYQLLGDWGDDGWQWVQRALKDQKFSPDGQRVVPRLWQDEEFGIQHPLVPVVGVSWYEANTYCQWLHSHWDACQEAQQNPDLQAGMLRLPTEREWEEAAGGIQPEGRYVWDAPGKITTDLNEIMRRANVSESGLERTTPVHKYPWGQSTLGVWDMAGNVSEWQANIWSYDAMDCVVRGGSWFDDWDCARAAVRVGFVPGIFDGTIGFRVVCFAI